MKFCSSVIRACASLSVLVSLTVALADQEPRVVDAGPPPSDAIVLFDGKDLSQWESDNGGKPKWDIKDGAMVMNGTGGIHTKQAFGDCQLHVEWATPAEVSGEGQGRGNSGIFLQGRYEIQVLDSWKNPTYFNGMAGSVYAEYPPLVNVSRKPGEWQSYDIIYHAPRFDDKGLVLKPATVTILQNGVLVQDNSEIKGRTAIKPPHTYEKHRPKEPLSLQDHGNPVKFRNIWIREL